MPPKPKTPQPETPEKVQIKDLFRTPRYGTELLLPFIPKNIKYVFEPAAGEGHITKVLQSHGYKVLSADIVKLFDDCLVHNFLSTRLNLPQPCAIITNPPFSLKKRFYEQCGKYGIPFALLIPADYSQWLVDALRLDGAEKIVPNRRIDFITPNGRAGKKSGSQFHSMWLTWGFGIGKSETFVELTNEDKKTKIYL